MNTNTTQKNSQKNEIATFGAGCFWCVEAVFNLLDGVVKVISGYMGGQTDNPSYQEICGGQTGHAEVTQIEFDPLKISYEELLNWFWKSHTPTTLNQQGADKGTQYRSVIFFNNEHQRAMAVESRKQAQQFFETPIVTEITKASTFFTAEAYHQDYYNLNKSAPYCQMVITPKLEKLKLSQL